MSAEILDADVRARASGALGTSIALTAGAGAGKTRVLVDRLVNLLAAGHAPRRLAAITFTERAASEIAARVYDACERRRAASSGSEAAHLTRAVSDLSELTVSTLHAFATELLRAEALLAAWAPNVEASPGELAGGAAERAFARWRRDFDRRHPDLAARLRGYASDYSLFAAAREVLRNRDLELVVGPEELPWAEVRGSFERAREALLEAHSACLRKETCKLATGNAELLEALGRAAAIEDHEAALRAYLVAPKDSMRGGAGKDWPGESKARFTAMVQELRELRKRFEPLLTTPVHRALMLDLRDHYLPLVAEEKRAHAEADFDDLLFRAAALLEERPAARARLARRFDALLVDEVQDTDPIQARIVALLSREPEAEGPWDAHPPRPGALFAVGDPKQSIYRFRRADVATWQELEALIARGGERGTLSTNFRSVPGIVGFGNFVFSGLPGYAKLTAHRAPAELDPVVLLRADDDTETEAAVHHLAELVRSGARVFDAEAKDYRPMRWRDVMVLLPGWTHAAEVQAAFHAAGIDCLVEGGRSYFARDEVRLGLAALRALEEPGDAEAVVFVLRGLFGLSHVELADHRARGGAWRYTVPKPPAGPVGDALAALLTLHRDRAGRSWASVLDALLEHTRAPAVWILTPRGRSMLANLEGLKALIRQVEATTRSPAEVVSQLVALSRSKDEPDLPLAGPEANAVKVTSIFKSKGLEAPVVVILHAHRRRQYQPALVDRAACAVAIRAGKLMPPDWEEREAKEKAAHAEEVRRWMYVAATRAEDQLVLVQTEGSKLLETDDLARAMERLDAATHGDLVELAEDVRVRVRAAEALEPVEKSTEAFPGLDDALAALLDAPRVGEPALDAPRVGEPALDAPAPVSGDPEGVAWAARRAARAQAAAQRSTRWRAVTESGALRREAMREERRGGLGMAAGKVIHAVMEHLDLARPLATLEAEGPRLLALEARRAGLSSELAARAEVALLGILRHPALDEARRAPERWQEVSFAFPEGRTIVSGQIDLCFPLDEARRRWMVVDFKSHLPTPGSELAQIYARQLETYCKALVHNLTGLTPEDVVPVLVGPHRELRAEQAEEAVEEVHPALAEGLRRLLDAGAPIPQVGLDTEDGDLLELAFEPKLTLVLPGQADAARLTAAGWTVIAAEPEAPGWAKAALGALAAALGVTLDLAEVAEDEALGSDEDPLPTAGEAEDEDGEDEA